MTALGSTPDGGGFQVKQVVRSRDQVELQIKDAILRGDLAQGEKLPSEAELAAQFGVSRPTVREALGSLVATGLIRKMSGASGGTLVNSVTPEALSAMLTESMDTIIRLGALDVAELTAMRHVLEIPAASRAAENRTAKQLRRLQGIVDRQRTTTVDDPKILEYDRDFHVTIAHASGNRLLAAFISAIHETTRPAQYLCVTPEVGRSTVEQHLAIVASVRDGHVSDAATAMRNHLEYVLRNSTDPHGTEH